MGANGPAWGRRFGKVRGAEDQWRELQRQADAAAVRYWNLYLEMRGPERPALTLGQAINGGYSHLRLVCLACKERAFVALADIRRPPDEPFWKMESRFACRKCRQGKAFRNRAQIERITKGEDWFWGNP